MASYARLGLFKNMVARKIFEPKREERRGKWKKLHMEEFYDLYSSTGTRARNTDYQIKKSEMVGTFVSNGERRGDTGI